MAAASVTASTLQSSLAGVSTRLPLDSPILPLCVSLALDCDLTPDAFASQWDAFRYSTELKQLDSAALQRFKQRLMEEREAASKRRLKAEDARRMDHDGVRVTNGGSTKRVYTHRDILEDDDILSTLLPAHTRVKQEREDWGPHAADDDAMEDVDATTRDRDRETARRRADKEEKKEADAFTTPSVPRHRSALPPSTSSPLSFASASSPSSSSASLLTPFAPLTPSTLPFASSILSTLTTTPSTYQSRANPSTILLTYNPTLAPPTPSPSDPSLPTRPVDIEVLLSPAELSELDQHPTPPPFRFMYAREEDVRDGLCERMEEMQVGLMGGKGWQRLVERMREEVGVKTEAVKGEGRVGRTDERKEDRPDVTNGLPADKEEVKEGGGEGGQRVKVDPELDLSLLDDVGLSSTSSRSQQPVVCIGRVCVDAASDDSRLSLSSVSIEGSLALSGCHRISLRLGTVPSYSLFPGQILLAKGVNAHGTAMVVDELLTSSPPPRLSLSPSDVQRYNASPHPLIIVAACGPFTTSDDLHYHPLSDLLRHTSTLQPDVLILQGPFFDAAHPRTLDGSTSLIDTDADFWPELLSSIPSFTRIILQPSLRDALHTPVFPQPPLTLPLPTPPHVTCVSNPATVRINDVTLGLTTLDVLSHLLPSTLTHNPPTRRLPHLASHLLHQASYYPLFPPPSSSSTAAAGEEAIDFSHAGRWLMPVRPELLLVPSALGKFVSEGEVGEEGVGGGEGGEGGGVGGVGGGGGGIIVNGGYLTRGSGGGTFVQITVHPKSEEEMRAGEEQGRVTNHLIQSRTRVDIIRI